MRCRSFTLLNDCSTTVTRPSAADGANDSNEAGAAAGNENLTVRTQSIAGVASGSPTGRSWPSAVILAQEHERQLRPSCCRRFDGRLVGYRQSPLTSFEDLPNGLAYASEDRGNRS